MKRISKVGVLIIFTFLTACTSNNEPMNARMVVEPKSQPVEIKTTELQSEEVEVTRMKPIQKISNEELAGCINELIPQESISRETATIHCEQLLLNQ